MGEIKPALSADEWLLAHSAGVAVASRIFARLQNEGVELRDKQFGAEPVSWNAWFGPERGSRLAALLLRGYFTWEDVDAIRDMVKACRHTDIKAGRHHGDHLLALVEDAAEKLAALLPPRET